MSVQLGMSNTFGCIPVDQAIELTANKEILDSRGHERIQFEPWNSRQTRITAKYRSICLQNLKGMVQEKPPDVSHANFEPARKKYKQSAHAVVNLVEMA